MLDAAVAADPTGASYRVGRAEHELALTPGSWPEAARRHITEDFTAALALDPRNVALRLKFAEALEKFGEPERAAEELERALADNGQLSREENKRLPDERVEEIRGKIKSLRGGK